MNNENCSEHKRLSSGIEKFHVEKPEVDKIEGTRHGNCEKCCEEGDPSCTYYGEPDGCNDRKWQAEHYHTTETYDYWKELDYHGKDEK